MKFRTVLIIILINVVINIFILKIQSRKDKSQVLTALNTSEEYKSLDTIESSSISEDRISANKAVTDSRKNALTEAVGKIEPAVVSVNVIKTQIVKKYTNPFQNPFFGFFDYMPYKREVQSIGSGVIFTQDGYILSNAHVVEGATEIKVILTDDRQFEADLIGLDNVHDVAILKISGEKLPCAKLGMSEDLIIGEWAIAVGNPYAYLIKDSKPSVTVGVISALDRNFADGNENKIYKKMIQTDTAINPGNSGGPLVNIFGEVIGLNTFIFSESGGSVGIGFAIPIDRVKEIAGELIRFGKIREPWFGFKIQDLNQMIASYMGLKSLDGVIVSHVDANGPADKAGLQRGDIIRKINEYKINSSDDAELAVSDISVNEKVTILVIRNKKEVTINLQTVEYK